MKDEDQVDVSAEADTETEKTDEQLWSEITGVAAPDDDDGSSDADQVESKPANDAREATKENAQGAVSEEDDGEKSNTPEQRSEQPDDVARLEKRYKGQVSGLSRKINALEREIAGYQKTAKRRGDDASLDALREEYPEIIGPLLEDRKAMREELDALSTQMSRVSELQRARVQTAEEAEERILVQAHSDWFETLQQNADEWKRWVNDQPADIRNTAIANHDAIVDGEGLADVIGLFKSHLNGGSQQPAAQAAESNRELPARRKRQLEGAQSIPAKGTQARSNTQPGEDDPEALWKSIVAQREARKR